MIRRGLLVLGLATALLAGSAAAASAGATFGAADPPTATTPDGAPDPAGSEQPQQPEESTGTRSGTFVFVIAVVVIFGVGAVVSFRARSRLVRDSEAGSGS